MLLMHATRNPKNVWVETHSVTFNANQGWTTCIKTCLKFMNEHDIMIRRMISERIPWLRNVGVARSKRLKGQIYGFRINLSKWRHDEIFKGWKLVELVDNFRLCYFLFLVYLSVIFCWRGLDLVILWPCEMQATLLLHNHSYIHPFLHCHCFSSTHVYSLLCKTIPFIFTKLTFGDITITTTQSHQSAHLINFTS